MAELYNSYIVVRMYICMYIFTDGESVNFALYDSYKTRCESAVISMNVGDALHYEINNKLLNKNMSNFILQYVNKKSRILDQKEKNN